MVGRMTAARAWRHLVLRTQASRDLMLHMACAAGW